MKKFLSVVALALLLPACAAFGVLKPKIKATLCEGAQIACSYVDAYCDLSTSGAEVTSEERSESP